MTHIDCTQNAYSSAFQPQTGPVTSSAKGTTAMNPFFMKASNGY
jgi:hypothetical protein